MKTSSLKMPNLASVLFVLFIVHPALISVQCRTRRSPNFSSGISDRINSPANLEIVPREALSSTIEFKIGNSNNLETAPRQLSPNVGDTEPSEDHLTGGRTRRSSKFGDGVSDRINSPHNVRYIPPASLSTVIEYRIGDANDAMTVPRQLSPKTEDAEPEDHLAGRVPEGYRIVPRKPEPPRIEMQLMKGHVSDVGANWIASVEYRFSDNYENDQSKSDERISATSESPVEQTTTKKKKGLDSRTIFEVPKRECPPGYGLDYKKQCRKAVEFWFGD